MDDLTVVGERRLRRDGKRITPQRRLVLSILAQADDHLDACEIFERGRSQDAHLSLSTIYRTLSVLKEAEVVRELHLDDEHHHYELAGKDEHAHLVCLACGRVIEVGNEALTEAIAVAGTSHGFRIASAQVELAGYCADCRGKDED